MFPSPIGGIPYPIDFAPSLVFAVAYGCLLPLVAYRIFDRNSRTILLIGSCIFTVERIVAFSLRAAQSVNASKRFNVGLMAYIQSDLALGYIGIAIDLGKLLRTLLVAPTYGSDTYVQSTEAESRYRYWISTAKLDGAAAGDKEEQRDFPTKPPEGTPDAPRTRAWIRGLAGAVALAFLSAIVVGIIATSNLPNVVKGEANTDQNMVLRYVSTAVALFLIVGNAAASVWAYICLPRVNRQGCVILFVISWLLCIIAVYRLSVMQNTTESLQSTASGSLNSVGDKAAFYIFHILPEWLSSALLFVFNTRRIFSTGFIGDWRLADEGPKEKERRLKKEAAHREKLQLRKLEDPQ
ncbi:hypothetical protein P691DRAFT_801514 [Macrolepiota fuliginosa MF-IS2]|uniref:Uncharacterized protein n=1 Tax=Macrolepiota fuliginosa MF-IS2 TaxID=1400762 RepID=A0A9P6C1M9_9AGAR|nr:hypothetical protein P691DRAFT_801514 [Macrolepiota fuliginosa MF-IS2]